MTRAYKYTLIEQNLHFYFVSLWGEEKKVKIALETIFLKTPFLNRPLTKIYPCNLCSIKVSRAFVC